MAEFLSDATLLERYVSDREEAAFVALVRRHGPRVERICRRILRNEHDVEDVLQATFLVLARKAAGTPWRDSVSPWIDGVARRLALHTRSGSARQRVREKALTTLVGAPSDQNGSLPERFHPVVEPSAEVERRDLRRVLDDELLRLPEMYRVPVVLCDLEGHTHEEAARRLGWPAGSMSRRLDRARSLLRRRLTYRGVALGVIGLASLAVAVAVGRGTDRSDPASSVRQAMATFRPPSEGGEGYGPILASAARMEGSRPEFARILPAARAAAAVARRIEEHTPGRSVPLWSRFATEMRDSAMEVERACEESDAMALVAAARRLDASCVNCHAVFRRGPAPADLPESGRVSSLYRLPNPPDRPRPTPFDPARVGGADRSWTLADGRCPTDAALRPGSARRSPAFAAPSGLVSFASNEWMGTAVKTDGPDRRSIIPWPSSFIGGRWPGGASGLRPRDARAGPIGSPAC
jgi:RNA polymerase sigma-70 factor (ECF subfamily)